MPYIKQEKRPMAEVAVACDSGTLNYQLSMKCLDYMEEHGKGYDVFNDIIGALESCKLEFYRRIIVPYENEKIEENGDVY